MTVHAIWQPDVFAGREPRRILWNDETGEVSGEHSNVPTIRDVIAKVERDGHLIDELWGRVDLRDPRHDAAEFHAVLMWALMAAYDRRALPPALREVDPTPRRQRIPKGCVV